MYKYAQKVKINNKQKRNIIQKIRGKAISKHNSHSNSGLLLDRKKTRKHRRGTIVVKFHKTSKEGSPRKLTDQNGNSFRQLKGVARGQSAGLAVHSKTINEKSYGNKNISANF